MSERPSETEKACCCWTLSVVSALFVHSLHLSKSFCKHTNRSCQCEKPLKCCHSTTGFLHDTLALLLAAAVEWSYNYRSEWITSLSLESMSIHPPILPSIHPPIHPNSSQRDYVKERELQEKFSVQFKQLIQVDLRSYSNRGKNSNNQTTSFEQTLDDRGKENLPFSRKRSLMYPLPCQSQYILHSHW